MVRPNAAEADKECPEEDGAAPWGPSAGVLHEVSKTHARLRRRPPYTPGPTHQRVCAPCNPSGSPFVAAEPWVVRGADALVLVCEGCGRTVAESVGPFGCELR